MKLSNCIYYLLAISQHEVYQRFSSRLSAYEITPRQYGILSILWQSKIGAVTPKEIAAILRLEPSTISSVLDRMQKQGLIHRTLDEKDRRSIQVEPTETGWSIRDGVLNDIEELNKEYSVAFAPVDWAALCSFLKKIGKISREKS